MTEIFSWVAFGKFSILSRRSIFTTSRHNRLLIIWAVAMLYHLHPLFPHDYSYFTRSLSEQKSTKWCFLELCITHCHIPRVPHITTKCFITNRFAGSPEIIYLWIHRFRFRNGLYPHSTVILKEYFENILLKSCNIAKIFIKLLERFLKYFRNLAMSVQNIINGILLKYKYFILILL